MTAKGVGDILGARVLTGEEFLDWEIRSTCDLDVMSDILTLSEDHSILLAGLCDPQVVWAVEMLDIVCIVFVRGEKPDESMLEMAKNRGLTAMETGHRMSSTCGILYQAELHGGTI